MFLTQIGNIPSVNELDVVQSGPMPHVLESQEEVPIPARRRLLRGVLESKHPYRHRYYQLANDKVPTYDSNIKTAELRARAWKQGQDVCNRGVVASNKVELDDLQILPMAFKEGSRGVSVDIDNKMAK